MIIKKMLLGALCSAGLLGAQEGMLSAVKDCLLSAEQCMLFPSDHDQPRSLLSCITQSSLGIGCMLGGFFCVKDIVTENAYENLLQEKTHPPLLRLKKLMKHSGGIVLLAVGIRALLIGMVFC